MSTPFLQFHKLRLSIVLSERLHKGIEDLLKLSTCLLARPRCSLTLSLPRRIFALPSRGHLCREERGEGGKRERETERKGRKIFTNQSQRQG